MRPIRLATTATMMMMTRIERDWASDRGFRTAFGATASETGHLHPLNKRPMDVYYPDNISADLEPAARNQAEEGGTRAAGFVAFRAAERLQAKACPGLDPGRKPVRVKKTRQIGNLEPRFDSIETEKAPGA